LQMPQAFFVNERSRRWLPRAARMTWIMMMILPIHVLAAGFGILTFSLAMPVAAQQSVAVIKVVDSLSRRGIGSADIADLRSGVRVRTDAEGEARLQWPADGILSIRVRQLGYVAVTRELRRDAGSNALTIAIERVSYVLPPVKTKSTSACAPSTDSVSARLSVMALEQIRLGAERYEAFRRDYPFRATVTRRTATVGADGRPTRLSEETGDVESEKWGDPYRPGDVIQRSGLGFTIPLLFLGSLAQPEFWKHHCFRAAGVEEQNGARLLRLDFEPARTVRSPDWEGSAFIDSATSMLVRIDFRLARLTRTSRVQRLEGYTTFKSPSPFFVIPDSTVAGWWKREPPENGRWGLPDVAQSLHTAAIEYRKARPPAN
jgi:hypothetical protein